MAHDERRKIARRARRPRRSRALAPAARCSDSPPGKRQSRPARSQPAYSSGSSRATSSNSRPSQRPRLASRSRHRAHLEARAARRRSRPSLARGSDPRTRSRRTPSPASRAASSAACARPVSFRGVSETLEAHRFEVVVSLAVARQQEPPAGVLNRARRRPSCPSASPAGASPARARPGGAMLPRFTSARNGARTTPADPCAAPRTGSVRATTAWTISSISPSAPHRRAEDTGGAALPRLGDHLPRAGVQLLLDLLHPPVRRRDPRVVLRADLGEDCEVLRQPRDQFELASCSSAIVPSEISTCTSPQLMQPGHQASSRSWAIASSVRLPPSTTGIPCCGSARALPPGCRWRTRFPSRA